MPSSQEDDKLNLNRKKIRLPDYFYYYFDLVSKIISESLRDLLYFCQRVSGLIFAQIFNVISIFFNPISKERSIIIRLTFGIFRIVLGLILLSILCLSVLIVIMIGGTLSGLLGFRNIIVYPLKEQVASWLVLAIILGALPLFVPEFALYKISLFFCFTLALVGFNFLYGQCGILSLGHAGFISLGGFVTAFFYNGSFGFKLPFLLSMIISSACSFLLGLILGLPSLRVKDYYLVIVTLAFMLAVPQILSSQYLAPYTGVSLGGLSAEPMPIPRIFAWMSQPTWNYFFVLVIFLFLIFFAYNLMYHSSIGRAFRTIKCDVEISTILGIPVVKYKLLAFAISSVYASVAGSMIMYLNRFISSDSYNVSDSIDYIVAAVVGGPESILGCITGALFLTFQKDLATGLGHSILRGDQLARMFYGIIMIAVVFVAPRGIASEFTRMIKTRFVLRPQRGKYYYSPPPDYDFLNMKGTTIKEE